MAFVNLSLLFGGLLTAIPIILHLVLRQQPKRIAFPALRFLKERRESNQRQLQLRQWLLLFLRCAAFLLLALALARPSAATAMAGNWLIIAVLAGLFLFVLMLVLLSARQKKGVWLTSGLAVLALLLAVSATGLMASTLTRSVGPVVGDQQAPVAAALVFDTSPRMEYRYHNQTRLEVAKETGLWLLSQFPPDSSLAVMESRSGPAFFSVDFAAAKNSVERLRTTGVPDPLASVVARAVGLVRSSDRSRREVYVFTDLAEQAWTQERSVELRQVLDENPDVLMYLIDVGVADPRNVSLGTLQLSTESMTPSAELVVSTDVRSQNAAGEYSVELLVEEQDPSKPIIVDGKPLLPAAQVRGRELITLPESGSQRVEFRVRGWALGTHQGFVRLSHQDGLANDDIRYFSVDIRDAWPVLLVAPRRENSFLLTEALSPFEQRETGSARFDTNEVDQSQLPNLDLSNFSLVCLADPEPLPPAGWDKLLRYVERGGSLLVFLGPNAQPVNSFNEPAAQKLLGANIGRQPWRSADRELFLAPDHYEHPALGLFRGQTSGIPWSDSPVFRHWILNDLATDSSAIMNFSNGKPAILERPVGRGRVIVTATPFGEPSRPTGRPAWNELLTSENAWPNFVLLNELCRYLASGQQGRLNYSVGETAVLLNDESQRDNPLRYQLFTPLEEPQEVLSQEGSISIPFTDHPGAYRLKGQRDGPVVRGFAVNLTADASDLTRISRDELDKRLGKDRYRYARDREDIVLEVGEARVGREFYPYLLLVLVVVLGLEHTLANRFYRSESERR